MDWVKWHMGYETTPSLLARLELVRAHITSCLDASQPGPIHVLSLCAGDGRDLIEALTDHPRAPDVRAHLIEASEQLVQKGRAAVEVAGLAQQIEFVCADATDPSTYAGLAPADLVLLCGVLGNVPDEDVSRLVKSLSCLCRTGGFAIWTRSYQGKGSYQIARIKGVFHSSGFKEDCFDITPDGTYGIGTHRHMGEVLPLPKGLKLFEFAGPYRATSRIQGKFLQRRREV
jgi:hypothetical protein